MATLPGPPKTCRCCRKHTPQPLTVDNHHIQPESWHGPTTADNLVVLCPTCHHSVHALIDLYVYYNRKPKLAEMRDRFGTLPSMYMRRLADQAWASRPVKPTYTSIAWGHQEKL